MAFNKFHKRKKVRTFPQPGEEGFRVRLPRDGQVFGLIEQLHGGKRMTTKCSDGKIRLCRIPGRVRRVYVRPDDYVIVEPWSIEGDKKGDVIWKYRKTEQEWLKNRGYLDF